MSKFYFAYGSNLAKTQMEERCPECKYIGSGKLVDYRWFIYSRGYANIVSSLGDYVLGEVFSLSAADEEYLDLKENVAKSFYHKECMMVQTSDGPLECLVYLDSNISEGRPKEEYIGRINKGLSESNLSEEYVAKYIRPYIPV